jgi:hypothetical protein
MSQEIPKSPCPTCGYEVDRATCFTEQASSPSSGDISVCFECGSIAVYTDALSLRSPTEAEVQKLKADTEVWFEILRVQQHVRARGV